MSDISSLSRRNLLLGAGAAFSLVLLGQEGLATNSSPSKDKKNKQLKANDYFNEDILHRNEHPLGVSPDFIKSLQEECGTAPFHHYKYLSEQTTLLKKAISRKLNTSEDLVYLAPGAGPTLEKILNTVKWDRGSFAISDPDFYFLTRVAEYMKLKVFKVPTTDKYEVDLVGLAKTGANYIYFSNPHVPYGRAKTRQEIEVVLKSLEKNQILIVDEAYIDFSDRAKDLSCVDLVKKYQNLIVVRTFSKIYGLASLRIGYYVTQNKKFSEYFTIYTISGLSAKAALLALDDTKRFDETFAYIKMAKEKVVAAAKTSDLKYIASEANFVTLLTTAPQREKIVGELQKKNYSFAAAGKSAFLRITLASAKELQDAVQSLAVIK
ncbi:MAG: histidinol-phosphate aminotransferase family protein [Bdellovibrio sp.]|nr:histidinol-phosphate aminotransferase family protein [Bdellovibrio sp.]